MRRPGVCADCGEPIYLNTRPERTVDAWVHRDTGSRYCDRTETTTARPREADRDRPEVNTG